MITTDDEKCPENDILAFLQKQNGSCDIGHFFSQPIYIFA